MYGWVLSWNKTIPLFSSFGLHGTVFIRCHIKLQNLLCCHKVKSTSSFLPILKHNTHNFPTEIFCLIFTFLDDVEFLHSMDFCFHSDVIYASHVSSSVIIWLKNYHLPYCTTQENLMRWLNICFCGPQHFQYLTWASHLDQVRRRASRRLGGPLLKSFRSLSNRNRLTLYRQLIRPMMGYACPVWRYAASRHIRRLQVIQSRCLCITVSAPWYIRNLQLHEDLEVPCLAKHIRNLVQSFTFKIPDSENLLIWQLERYLFYPKDEYMSVQTWPSVNFLGLGLILVVPHPEHSWSHL